METVTIVIDAANAIMKYNVLIVVPIGCCFELFVETVTIVIDAGNMKLTSYSCP